MELSEIDAILEETGYPVAYQSFREPQAMPYIAYTVPFEFHFFADNRVHTKIKHLQIELYTSRKDPVAETILEAILEVHGLAYEKSETYIDEEFMHQTIYESEV